MPLILPALALYQATRALAGTVAGAAPPNPAPQAPPGLTGPVTTIIAWGKWGVLVCGVAGLLMNTATEFAQKDPEIAGRVNLGLAGLRGIFERAVLRGQREGEITTEKDAKSLAAYLVCSLGGIKTVVKGGGGEADLREIVDIVLRGLK